MASPEPRRALRVLIVEDDPAMAMALRDGFAFEGHRVLHAADGAAGLELATEAELDLVILDVMLPKLDGLEVCRRLRAAGREVPVILLTARSQESDKVEGLRLGADDYVTKPFSFVELLARVDALLRRVRRGGEPEIQRFGDVAVDFRRLTATRAGEPLDLSPREFAAPPGGLGLRDAAAHAHRRHAHREAAAEDRARPRRALAHRHGPRRRVPIHRLTRSRSPVDAIPGRIAE
jgi:CheY-like chemotaxis protein